MYVHNMKTWSAKLVMAAMYDAIVKNNNASEENATTYMCAYLNMFSFINLRLFCIAVMGRGMDTGMMNSGRWRVIGGNASASTKDRHACHMTYPP